MTTINKQYIYGADGEPVAVVLDLETFREIEEILQDIEDIKIVEARRSEPDLDWDEVRDSI